MMTVKERHTLTLFSSSKHLTLTTDPDPVVDSRTGARHSGGNCYQGSNAVCNWDPRPKYAQPLTNPANPILEAFRGNVINPHPDDTLNGSFAEVVDLWAFYMETGNQEVSFDDAEIDHAKRVINRLRSILRSEVSA